MKFPPPQNKLNLREFVGSAHKGRDKTQETRNGCKFFFELHLRLNLSKRCEWSLEHYIVCMWWMGMFHIWLCMHLDVWRSSRYNLREVFLVWSLNLPWRAKSLCHKLVSLSAYSLKMWNQMNYAFFRGTCKGSW